MEQKKAKNLIYYQSNDLDTIHGFSTKEGGCSLGKFTSLNLVSARGDSPRAVVENYRRFHQAIGYTGAKVARNNQVHGDTVRQIQKKDAMDYQLFAQAHRTFPSGDALITQEKNIALWVYSADCPTLLYHDPVTQAIAAVHSGWRGTALGIAQKTVEAMTSAFGTKPENLQVALGPAIGSCCFSCHEDVPKAMTEALGEEARPFLLPEEEGKFAVDLWGLNRLWLKKAGVTPPEAPLPCTACTPDLFWSHRVLGEARGTQGAMIVMVGE